MPYLSHHVVYDKKLEADAFAFPVHYVISHALHDSLLITQGMTSHEDYIQPPTKELETVFVSVPLFDR